MIIIGIDPGIKGAIAFYRPQDGKLKIYDMPKLEKENGRWEVDSMGVTKLVSRYVKGLASSIAVIEDVSAMTYVDAKGNKRGQGAAASFAFGKGVGQLLGVLAAHWIRVIPVKPSVWKSLMNVSSDKSTSIALARERFPKYCNYFAKKSSDGRAEAALLCLFAVERFGGNWP